MNRRLIILLISNLVISGSLTSQLNAQQPRSDVESWRYVPHNGVWWYYLPNGQWAYNTGTSWNFYHQPPVSPPVISVPQTSSSWGGGYTSSPIVSPGTANYPPGFWNGPNRAGAGWVNGFFSSGGGRRE
jgi:hypothetical protein